MKVAVLIQAGDINVKRGYINACINRIKELKKYKEFDVDVYYIRFEKIKLSFKNILHKPWKDNVYNVDDIKFNILWSIEYFSQNKYKNYIARFINKFFYCSYWGKKWIKSLAPLFRRYDFLTVHARECAYIANYVKRKYNIPYFCSWYGSDIHTVPYVFPIERDFIIKAIECADVNFFCSKALLQASEKLTKNANKDVLYNGYDSCFQKMSFYEKNIVKKKYELDNSYIVGFAGELRDIKNADLLPDIFNGIEKKINRYIKYIIIGSGCLTDIINDKIERYNLNSKCRMLGYVPQDDMPGLLNCIDLMVIPSKNEGLPLISLEALSCGANVVGSMVGGIPEAIGDDFCVPLGSDFIDRFVDKCVSVITNNPTQPFDRDLFSWEKTVAKEVNIYRNYMKKNI